ncbi:UbiD family decarboxylase [Albibacterium bauzanense]|uniref:4-hydroxy-3-polyprenylbenzoate decarboxylase n=1 Tax=Albibacterium bauzanense TaxID=653929 RepID=A0A4R1M1S2_9SPHI|nr:UbiD family decarboxylase [Albibacterium bauzanense]TCK83549.1 4-hydroxy-3-polyprenylbenzoate decarboxylase [Albibacterium bauzanense]
MGYKSLAHCVEDLERNGHLIRVKEEVDPYLEMAAIHMRVYDQQGPALLFENVKGSQFPAVSNLFGTLERSHFMFRDTLENVKRLVSLRSDPFNAIKKPIQSFRAACAGVAAIPIKSRSSTPIDYAKIQISSLPQIVNWPMDGGAFVTMPQVYTEDIDNPGPMKANLGMYRIQLNGNDYIQDQEIGLHYQLHRGIGIHQTKANELGKPLKVSIFVGGPPSHALAAVMPLPEGLSELTFAGVLGNRHFRYFYDKEGFCISADADFVITGTVYPNENKPEGPFGDHLGYYSLVHPFPLMRVHNVYHRKDPIWSFTVVGRPPQEDTSFGALIHDITGSAMSNEINGLHAVNAVDAAGVHPLLLAIGSERYTPYLKLKRPQEILTIANQILGTNQLSLAKYLFISAYEDQPDLDIYDVPKFFQHILERLDPSRDLHFHTQTSIDTLDYSGEDINSGSKVVFAAAGDKLRELITDKPLDFPELRGFINSKFVMPGIIAVETIAFKDYETDGRIINEYAAVLENYNLTGIGLIVLCDDAFFASESLNNFLWVTFTRSNPSHDIYGVGSFISHKHWGCKGPIIIDARKKPHHAPELVKDEAVENRINRLGIKGKSLYGII